MSDLIDTIRQENGCDPEMLRRAKDNPEVLSTIKALQGNASRGLERLSDELYSKSTHFLLEFIQNADDNSYKWGVTPTLRLKLEDGRITIQCNELGFTEANVKAICRIGASTKKGKQGYIGEKGIGFKSVFKVADVVHIHSGDYKFKLDRREELGMITPRTSDWQPTASTVSTQGWTSFYLLLSPSEKMADLAAHFEQIQPSLLLFLRKLRTLNVQIALRDTTRNKSIQIRCVKDQSDIVTLERLEDGRVSSQRYFTLRHEVQMTTKEDKRPGMKQSEIVLAFPIDADGAPQITTQPIHAFLPIRNYGFTFLIQADFLTSASREDILNDSEWNKAIRQGLFHAFIRAVECFKSQPGLRFTWFRFLPENLVDWFFKLTERQIISRLQTSFVLCNSRGQFHKSSNFIIPPPNFCDEMGVALIPEGYLPPGRHYLSPKYDVVTDNLHFLRLGVETMSEDTFLNGLANLKNRITTQPDTWHEAVCGQLLAFRRVRGQIRSEVYRLRLIPLRDGTWTSASEAGSDIYFDSKIAGIPEDLGLRLLSTKLAPGTSRHRLFEALGVRQADSKQVAAKILELHSRRSKPKSAQSFIDHAVFMFVHRYPVRNGFLVVDEQGAIANGKDLYIDLLDSRQTIRMRDILPFPARFLHPGYLKMDMDNASEDWSLWLKDSIGLNVFPRLVDGALSPEFMALAKHVSSSVFLVVLKEVWPKWSGKLSPEGLSRLQSLQISCEDGSIQALNSTYLRRGPLVHYPDLPFLPVKLPAAGHWQFLRDLGVVLHVDVIFFLRRLLVLKTQTKYSTHDAQKYYKQIEARFDDDSEAVRMAFTNESLILIPAQSPGSYKWISTSDAVWSGPASMTSKVMIKSFYPSSEKFFRVQLGLQVAEVDLLAVELKSFARIWKDQVIPTHVLEQILAILQNISQILNDSRHEPSWLSDLADEAIFPAFIPVVGLKLCSSLDPFYIPDRSGKLLAFFGTRTAVLVTSEQVPLYRLQPLFSSSVFCKNLKYLEEVVLEDHAFAGSRAPDWQLARKYSSRAVYVERLVRHTARSGLSVERQRLISKIKNAVVETVDQIETTFTLGEHHHSKLEDVIFSEDDSRLAIQKSKSCSSATCDIHVSAKLAALLDIEVDHVLTLLSQDEGTINVIMRMKGIPEAINNTALNTSRTAQNADDETRSTARAEAAKGQITASDGKSERQNSGMASIIRSAQLHREAQLPPRDSESKVTSPTTESQRQIGTGLSDRTAEMAPGSLRNPLTSDSFDLVRDAAAKSSIAFGATIKDDAPGIAKNYTRSPMKLPESGINIVKPAGNPERPPKRRNPTAVLERLQAQDRRETNQVQLTEAERHTFGTLGELYVYALLLKELPDFSSDNWTSELRGEVPGFEPYPPGSLADFTYRDTSGVLTTLLFGKEKHEMWKNHWPTFYLEVKSTPGDIEEPFHMSRRQLQIAAEFSSDKLNRPPQDVFAIIRVFNVVKAPWHVIYVDPHRQLYQGKLQIRSDSVEIVCVEGQGQA